MAADQPQDPQDLYASTADVADSVAAVAQLPPDPDDPYVLHESRTKEPPTDFWGKLKYIGPGFILSASIVGSGELIATTILGAKAGFVLLWFIIFSCIVKVAVQLEFGKHAIGTGESTMATFNRLPGPKFGQANWSIWAWLLLMIGKMFQVGGIVGGVVLVTEACFPGGANPENQLTVFRVISTIVVAMSVSLLVYRGYYQLLEKASLIMISLFTVFTLASLISLQGTDLAITSSEFMSGLIPSLSMDSAVLWIAVGAFGITGVGGDEIMAYNYWLIEKGYAAFTGPRDNSEAWLRRAKGWIGIMYLDAILSMVAYTLMTAMFYLLGAAVLHRTQQVPEKSDLINVLAEMYTQSLGPWAKNLFLVGAFVVLFSTLFAALAAWSRLFSDSFSRIGFYRFEDRKARGRAIAACAWVIPLIWGFLFLLVTMPGAMVIIGGSATTVILLIVVFATMHARYKRLDPRLTPGAIYDVILWVSAIAIVLVAIQSGINLIPKKAPTPPPAAAEQEQESHAGVRTQELGSLRLHND